MCSHIAFINLIPGHVNMNWVYKRVFTGPIKVLLHQKLTITKKNSEICTTITCIIGVYIEIYYILGKITNQP